MRFFSPKPDRGHEAVWEARAGSCLHVALIVRLEGLGRATDAAWMRSWIAAADFGHRDSTLAVNTQLKGEDFCLFSMALTGLEPGRLRTTMQTGFGSYSSGSSRSSSASFSRAASRASASALEALSDGFSPGSSSAAGCVAAWTCCNVRMATCV